MCVNSIFWSKITTMSLETDFFKIVVITLFMNELIMGSDGFVKYFWEKYFSFVRRMIIVRGKGIFY